MTRVDDRLDRIENLLERIEKKIGGAVDERPAYTVTSLAVRLALSERTVRDMLSNGVIASYRDGGSRRVDPREVDRYLAERRRAASGDAAEE